jgi:IclR family transcriptional regulator, positive regulator for flagellar biogenesis
MTMPADKSPDTVSALERGIAVLRCFTEARRHITPTELSRLTGIPRPTATRLASTLCTLGLLRQDAATEAYMLGPGVVSLARVFLAGLDVRATARPHMQALADVFGGSVYLAIRDGLEMVLIEACRARASMLAARLDVGSRAPIVSSALGRAYLSAIEPVEREALLETLRLARGAEWSLVQPGLKQALDEARRYGWCLSAGEFHREINSVSVPLVGPQGEVMALNCGGAAFAFGEERLRHEVGPQLLVIARDIAAEIGGHVPQQELATS